MRLALALIRAHLILICLVGMSLIAGSVTPYFWTAANLGNILSQAAIPSFLSVGACFVIGSGQIDLSVGSILALGALINGVLLNYSGSALVAFGGSIIIGGIAGVLNGFLASLLPSFIVTLGTMAAFRGLALAATASQSVNLTSERSWLVNFSTNGLIVFVIALAVGAVVIFRKTRFGLVLLAIGSNEKAARNLGVKVAAHRIAAFVLCDGLAALAGAFLTLRLGAARPTAGTGYELDAIASVIVGGAVLTGGAVSVLGALAATVLFSTIRNSFALLNVTPALQQVLTGGVLVVVVLAQRSRQQIPIASSNKTPV